MANLREGNYSGAFDQCVAFLLRLVEAVRAERPTYLPLFVRLSAVDWVDDDWDLAQSVKHALALRARGVDLIDCFSGSILPGARGKAASNYQVPFAAAIMQRAGLRLLRWGLITEARLAKGSLATAQADLIFVGRKVLVRSVLAVAGAARAARQSRLVRAVRQGGESECAGVASGCGVASSVHCTC